MTTAITPQMPVPTNAIPPEEPVEKPVTTSAVIPGAPIEGPITTTTIVPKEPVEEPATTQTSTLEKPSSEPSTQQPPAETSSTQAEPVSTQVEPVESAPTMSPSMELGNMGPDTTGAIAAPILDGSNPTTTAAAQGPSKSRVPIDLSDPSKLSSVLNLGNLGGGGGGGLKARATGTP
jgi:hypothetical protein